jgi:hypothetical protein
MSVNTHERRWNRIEYHVIALPRSTGGNFPQLILAYYRYFLGVYEFDPASDYLELSVLTSDIGLQLDSRATQRSKVSVLHDGLLPGCLLSALAIHSFSFLTASMEVGQISCLSISLKFYAGH